MSTNDDSPMTVPVWMVGTEAAKLGRALPVSFDDQGITPERLGQLRDAMAAFMDTPLVTLESYPVPSGASFKGGRLLDAASPLSRHLADLVTQTARSAGSGAPVVSSGGETLYRMLIPAKVAKDLGTGLARSMPSSVAAGGVHSGILGKGGIVAQATFVPVVAQRAGAAGLVTVAAPLAVLAIATGATIYAEEQRRKALERITDILKDLKRTHVEAERDELLASSKAIEKATAVLLDQGKVGLSLGLDSAVHKIDTAVEAATRRADGWLRTLDSFEGKRVSVELLKEKYPGIERTTGEFRAQLRMASFVIAMKRRVAVLQAVEAAQGSPGLTLPRFTTLLKLEQAGVDDLEYRLADFLMNLSRVNLRPPTRIQDILMTRGEVSDLLQWPERLRELAETESPSIGTAIDLEVDMIRKTDGKLLVMPLAPVA